MIGSEDELAGVIAACDAPLVVQGGGTRGMVCEGDVLSLAGLAGISRYEPGALTMVAQAGTPLAQVEAALEAEGQRLAFEPMDHRGILGTAGAPTIGGVFAANVSGPRRLAVGAARDFLLGVRFVDGTGQVISNGGRVMKNVTGYDLVKLMAGSFGTLGVLSEVSFKVLPKPEVQASLVMRGMSVQDAVGAMSRAMGSPYEVSAAGHDPAQDTTVLRVEGFEASVKYRVQALQDMLRDTGAEMEVLGAERSAVFWEAQRDVAALAKQAGDVWKVSCRPSQAAGLADLSGARALLLDWAGGLIWMVTEAGDDLRARLGAFDGHATLVRASDTTKVRLRQFHPEPSGVARLTEGLRARFDPRGILNPGLMEGA